MSKMANATMHVGVSFILDKDFETSDWIIFAAIFTPKSEVSYEELVRIPSSKMTYVEAFNFVKRLNEGRDRAMEEYFNERPDYLWISGSR